MLTIFFRMAAVCLGFLGAMDFARANVSGGGTNGPNVTLTDNGSTVTLANGIISIVVTKSSGVIGKINYTFNNSGSSQTMNVLAGGHNGGQLYWEDSSNQGLTFSYALVVNPASNGGNYAEIALTTTTVSNIVLEVHYSLLRGNSGFYVTPIWIHRASDGAFSMGECRDNIYAGAIFNWMSVDATRNRLMAVSGAAAVGVLGAPVEVSLWTNGIYAGQYEDKYKYTADYGDQRAWGWSSVGAGGKNIGLWDVLASAEYYPGGPMKRELMCHIGTTILNTPHGSHFGGGTDSTFAAGEVWAKVCGPHFIYCNAISNNVTAMNAAAQALYNDALAQADAENSAWPYSWFANPYYAPASQRGTVMGKIVIADAYNPNASASDLWVGVEQQPNPATTLTYDFQKWYKPYQFWVKTDAHGNFTIPNVIAGTNYTLYAFGAGAAGTFQSQAQTGGSAPNELDIPSPPFAVNVTAGVTNHLGIVTWTPKRTGATVFEIGYPDRTGGKFRHGEDWWVGDIGPNPANPLPVWSKWLEYPFDFPNGVNYVVGQSRWTTDWNFVQAVVPNSAGGYNNSVATIQFNLAATSSGTAALYLALASDFQGPLIVQVNGNNLAGSTGYFPAYSSSGDQSDATIREGIHGCFSDNRLTFPGSLLRVGPNTITINMRKADYFANHAMYDYVRLEMPGYIPPPPGSVAAYAGNNANLISWPVTPGATGYNLLRSTTSGSGYVSITNGVTGPICGSGWNNATYLDTNVVNGATYYYVVQSVNPVGNSTNSPESPGATPSTSYSTVAPAAPTGVSVSSIGHQSVTLNWSASSGANFYTIYRSTLFNNGGGASNVLGTIVLANNVTGATYTDHSPTDGSIYSYFVTATSAGGTSANSASAAAVPLPAPPASAPASLTGSFIQTTNVLLNWSAVNGAVGYVIRQATTPNGPFNYVENVTATTYTHYGVTPGTYYYSVNAVNAGGVSTNRVVMVVAPPAVPASLSAVAGDSQITLTWSAVANATGYYLYRGMSSGGENITVLTNFSGTSYTDTGLVNGTTYYYVVAATNAAAVSGNSSEASATPGIVVGTRNLIWHGDGAANLWNVGGAVNWTSNGVATAYNDGDAVIFDDSGSNNVAVTLVDTLSPSLVTVNAAKNYTFTGGTISGTNALVKSGAGALILSDTNSFTGGIVVNGGSVTFSSGAAIPASGALTLNNTGAVTVVSANGLPDVVVNGTNTITGNGNSGTGIAKLDVEGMLNLFVSGGSKVFDLTGAVTGGGRLVLANSSAMTLRFNGTGGDANAIFDLGTAANFASVRNNATAIALGGLAGGAATTLQGAGSFNNAITYTIGGANQNTKFDGVIVNGGFTGNPATVIVKAGNGAQIFTGASTYSGGTTVNGGALLINNSSGSGTGTGAVTVNSGGTLSGNGIISGAVTVNSGGALAPGNPFGILTVNSNVTLAAGSTTLAQISASPLTNGSLQISGTLTFAGTLNVTNLSAANFVAGNHFQIFSATNFAGGFTGFVLPALTGTNLYWNTARLNVDGSLWVMSRAAPDLAQTSLAGGNLILRGNNGTPGWTYYVLMSTNLSLPAAQWTRVATNQFDANGNFIFTNRMDLNSAGTFYRIQSP